MSVKYAVNGYRNCKIRIVDEKGKQEAIKFSSNRIIITETEIPASIRHKFNSGDKEKLPCYIELKWTLDLSEYMNVMDAMQLDKIKNAEFKGNRIFLTPHLDYPWREYEVLVLDEERQTTPIAAGYGTTGYIINFESRGAFKQYSWVNPNVIPVVAAESFFEFEN